ncbi:DUF962 domain-containing protein [Corallococcus sp. H22C18031201]|uniref:DUF962 domain-containing protein n=1 Tax=Citreicoccus inhibens TaxID=2849499 RepID=UPI000E7590FC|nr:DUF962 domain-containing protein [Citreicoccus inhibens]MBU8899822.1 DUF962 domain-containing protein [Citreicoccus inhibens]RJS21840.1 DUF962 domain-containing protein [Corallococcus sp. H22C18031201]
MSDRIQTYAEFWPFYLREHSLPITRWLHLLGTSLGVGLGVTAAVTGRAGLVGAAFVSAYGFAWVSHFTLEHNRPATFKYPLWSFISDFRMAGLMLTGQLGPHLERANAGANADASERPAAASR